MNVVVFQPLSHFSCCILNVIDVVMNLDVNLNHLYYYELPNTSGGDCSEIS